METPWSWRQFCHAETHHCTQVLVTFVNNPNMVNSSAIFLVAGDCVCGEGLQALPQSVRSCAGLTANQGQGHRYPEGEIPGWPSILPIAWIGWRLTHHSEFICPLCGLIFNLSGCPTLIFQWGSRFSHRQLDHAAGCTGLHSTSSRETLWPDT